MKKFSLNIIFRILLLAFFICPVPFLIYLNYYGYAALSFIAFLFTAVALYRYTTAINRKITFFFESIQYDDFTVKFSADNKLGKSFSELNEQLNQVIETFKTARAEKEANIHFLNTMVQHIDVGIICYGANEQIEILNNTAIRLLGVYRLRELNDLIKAGNGDLYYLIKSLESGKRVMFQTKNGSQLAINATKINLRGRAVKIISLQNIRTELQQKELSSWQNLTKVLRHEIMNSIAPIVSMVGTMRNIVDEDFKDVKGVEAPVADLGEALKIIELRGKGIMKFVNAYRDFTTLPKPVFTDTTASELLNRMENLAKAELEQKKVDFVVSVDNNFSLRCDLDQIEMVLINLIKNASESVEEKDQGKIELRAYQKNGQRFIAVKDNGRGIVPEALEKIFIPFYTTKKTGQGIGLSLSKQILQMHGGDLTAHSTLHEGAVFELELG